MNLADNINIRSVKEAYSEWKKEFQLGLIAGNVEPHIYVIEELDELVLECLKAIKSLTKYRRNKLATDDLYDELCDVITTCIMMLDNIEKLDDGVLEHIVYKLNRAAMRHKERREL